MRIRGREVPLPFALGLGILAILVLVLAGTSTGLVNVESLYFFLLGNTVATISTMTLAALGGVFLGMLAGHYLYASQSFTPFERRVLTFLEEVGDLPGRVDEAEERLAGDVEELRDEVEELREDLSDLRRERAP